MYQIETSISGGKAGKAHDEERGLESGKTVRTTAILLSGRNHGRTFGPFSAVSSSLSKQHKEGNETSSAVLTVLLADAEKDHLAFVGGIVSAELCKGDRVDHGHHAQEEYAQRILYEHADDGVDDFQRMDW